jgi:hypothetical protein
MPQCLRLQSRWPTGTVGPGLAGLPLAVGQLEGRPQCRPTRQFDHTVSTTPRPVAGNFKLCTACGSATGRHPQPASDSEAGTVPVTITVRLHAAPQRRPCTRQRGRAPMLVTRNGWPRRGVAAGTRHKLWRGTTVCAGLCSTTCCNGPVRGVLVAAAGARQRQAATRRGPTPGIRHVRQRVTQRGRQRAAEIGAASACGRRESAAGGARTPPHAEARGGIPVPRPGRAAHWHGLRRGLRHQSRTREGRAGGSGR